MWLRRNQDSKSGAYDSCCRLSRAKVLLTVIWFVSLLPRASSGEATPRMDAVDFADSAQVNSWLRHPVYGDPSFDAFERAQGNPIHRGAPPFEWPVNGFLFEDPRSGNWYVYVGLYAKGYVMGEGKGMACTVYRSDDEGRSWDHIGPIFPNDAFRFEGDECAVGYAPDVSVVYAQGRYHLVYDWATANATWDTVMNPVNGADNGIAYAWADRPEGPFIRTAQPVYRTSAHPFYRDKYRRAYAATLIRRQHDWLVLAMMDSGGHYGWALVGMRSEKPDGPYSKPTFLRCVEGTYFHPPLLEFYPAFVHDGYIYAPSTSVALNRNFQAVFRVETEQAMNPEAWELFQHGSVWHAEHVAHEHYGIWGQTFSGFVSTDNVLHVMFPSRDPRGLGTINLASRRWDRPYLRHGFTLSGHQGPSLTLIKQAYEGFDLEATLEVRGQASILWGYHAPLGPNRPSADASLHALSLTRFSALELSAQQWRIVQVDDTGTCRAAASGTLALEKHCTVALYHGVDGGTRLSVNGDEVWRGIIEPVDGAIGLLAGANSHVTVERFAVRGTCKEGRCSYLCTEAILGAGQALGAWRPLEASVFRYGLGAVSQKPQACGKWNVEGTGFSLWAPKGPEYGAADLFVDGLKVASLDFTASEPESSQVLFSQRGLNGTYHAILVRAKDGAVPLDVLEVVFTPGKQTTLNSLTIPGS